MPIRKTVDPEQEFWPSKRAILATIGSDSFDLDQDLKELRKVMIKPTYKNLEEGFWNDSVAVSFTEITGSVIVGDGPRVRCDKRQEAIDIIKRWNRGINVKRQTVEDWIIETWYDSIVYSMFAWRTDRSIEYENVDIQRLDPKTIEVREDPVMGYRKFIQHVPKYNYHRTKKNFYRSAGKDNYLRYKSDWGREPGKITYSDTLQSEYEEQQIHLADEPNVILFGRFFKKPPIANALHYIVYKRWILWFMRKYSQKHWAPFVILSVGDPRSNVYPTDIHKMQAALDNGKQFIRQITNFGGVSIPGEMEMKTLETQTARSSEIYVIYIQELDKQIMYTIFGSMGMREARGSELATSRILQESWLRFIKGIRRKYELILTNFYAFCLLPYHGINDVSPHEIEIDWSPLRLETTLELMQSIQLGAMVGVWNDVNEMRKAAQSAFGFLDELPQNENKKVEALAQKQPSERETQRSAKERLVEYNQSRKTKTD